MRKSFVAAVALVAALAIASPAAAGPRQRDRSEPPAITFIKKIVKKAFGISTTADPTVPIPPPPPTP